MTTIGPTATADSEWRVRPVLLAVIGAVAAAAVYELLDERRGYNTSAASLGIALFAGVSAAVLAVTLERVRAAWAVGFALSCGVIVGLIGWHGGSTRDWDTGTGWRMTCAFLAVAIATPLFQGARDEGRARFRYADIHAHAWTDAVMLAVAAVFSGIALALGWMIASLFRLIGVNALYRLMDTGWFAALLVGAALGGAIGLLREREGVVRTTLTVVLAVLRVLAPVLAVFLAAFVLFLPFTGLGKLWDTTRATTPILLGCTIAGLLLTNAVIGQDDADTAASPVLRASARLLSVVLLPLAVVAAVSLGWRIAQHGLSVDRLWALTFVAVATAYGVGYLVSVLRPSWVERLRATNLRMAFVVSAVALVLALPIVNFERIATNDQVARLASGRVSPDKFDWAALRFDYGAPGRAAVTRLAASATPGIAAPARRALEAENRWSLREEQSARVASTGLETRLRIVSAPTTVDGAIRDAIAADGQCADDSRCALIVESATKAIMVSQRCPQCESIIGHYSFENGRWAARYDTTISPSVSVKDDITQAPIEIRTVTRRQVFVGGKPVGEAFEATPAAVEAQRPLR